jgi:hypothetical protein
VKQLSNVELEPPLGYAFVADVGPFGFIAGAIAVNTAGALILQPTSEGVNLLHFMDDALSIAAVR